MVNYLIIVAGGTGQRMGSTTPKQFLPILNKPILQYTLENIALSLPQLKVLLVLPEEHVETWRQICQERNILINYQIIFGGKTRFHSVKNGIEFLYKTEKNINLVGITDGVRPFITKRLLEELYEPNLAFNYGRIPVINLKDSLRTKEAFGNKALQREDYCLVQTPQVFHFHAIHAAYQQQFDPNFTDDASVFEKSHGMIEQKKGDEFNLKITSPFDLIVAEAFLSKEINIHLR